MKELNLKIADINICYKFHNIEQKIFKKLPGIYLPFVGKKRKDSIKINIYILEKVSPIKNKGERIIFFDGKFWIQKEDKSKNRIIILQNKDKDIVTLAKFDSDFRRGKIFNRNGATFGFGHSSEFMLLSHPFDEIILINLLAKNEGFIMHGCGININNTGYLFLGDKGKGKSTMAKMIKELYPQIKILNDERVIIRKTKDSLLLFGQPWYSFPEFVSYGGIPLKKIFFLEHDNKNKIIRINKKKELFLKLLTHIPLPHWDKKGMNSIIEGITQIIDNIPCSTFKFTNDPSRFNINILLYESNY